MNREALDSLDKEALIRLVLTQAETIAALNRQVEMLTARLSRLEADNGALRAENAALREKLKLPAKTPDNSSTPPSQGRKPSADPAAASGSTGRRTSHPGAHRPLHPDPTRKRDILADHCRHCGTDLPSVAQTPFHAYDHIELPPIKPDVHAGDAVSRALPLLRPAVPGRSAGRHAARLAVRSEPAGLCHLSAVRPCDLVRAADAADVRSVWACDQRGRPGRHAGRQPAGLRPAEEPDPRPFARRQRAAVG